jgi:uncharacterized membrane protein
MRRLLDMLSFATLVVLLFITGAAIAGPASLPEKIPSHLDALGQPDAWTSRSSYEILPLIAAVVFLVLTLVAVYSSLAKNAAQADPESGPPFEAVVLRLIVWIKFELMAIFTSIQLSALHAARQPDHPSSIWSTVMWLLVAAIFVTVALHLMAIIRIGRSEGHKLAAR